MEFVQLKGTREGFKIVVSAIAKGEDIFPELKEKLENAKELFSVKPELNVIIEGITLTFEEKIKIQKSIHEVFGENVLIVTEQQKKTVISPETIFHTGTVRSGMNLKSAGHLVVKGDVNPGAEISAAGNIVVLGALKGIVHAGTDGNREAYVAALQLAPTQIRIADIITRAPDDAVTASVPEYAYIKDDRIYIDDIVKK